MSSGRRSEKNSSSSILATLSSTLSGFFYTSSEIKEAPEEKWTNVIEPQSLEITEDSRERLKIDYLANKLREFENYLENYKSHDLSEYPESIQRAASWSFFIATNHTYAKRARNIIRSAMNSSDRNASGEAAHVLQALCALKMNVYDSMVKEKKTGLLFTATVFKSLTDIFAAYHIPTDEAGFNYEKNKLTTLIVGRTYGSPSPA